MGKFVEAYDPETKRKAMVPEHWLQDGSPFPHLKPVPSSRDKRATKTAAAKKASEKEAAAASGAEPTKEKQS